MGIVESSPLCICANAVLGQKPTGWNKTYMVPAVMEEAVEKGHETASNLIWVGRVSREDLTKKTKFSWKQEVHLAVNQSGEKGGNPTGRGQETCF